MESKLNAKPLGRWLLRLTTLIVLLVGCQPLALVTSADLPQAADRIRNEPESVWVEFIQLALQHKPLNLGQGFPDFAAPRYLVDSLHNATRQNGDQKLVLNHQYTRSFGHPRLVKALRDYYEQHRGFNRLTSENEQILVTVGAYEALFTTIMAFVNPGDEVIIIEPAFDAYAPMVSMAGGKSLFVPLRLQEKMNVGNETNETPIRSTQEFKLDMEEFKRKISKKTRALVLNTPNNPLGKIFSRQELNMIAKLCIEYNILVIADEVYEQFYYDSSEHVSIASLPGMWERTVTIGSAGKTFSVTGWKIGWALGPASLIRYLQLVHQTAVYTVATPLQEAVARGFEHEMSLMGDEHATANNQLYWKELRSDLLTKRNRIAATLSGAKMRPILPQGGYFMLADFSPLAKQFNDEHKTKGIVDERLGRSNTNDFRFARWLSRYKHLQGIPASAFYSEENKHLASNLIRFCFIKSNSTLDKFDELVRSLLAAV